LNLLGRGGPYPLALANPYTDPSLEGTSYGHGCKSRGLPGL